MHNRVDNVVTPLSKDGHTPRNIFLRKQPTSPNNLMASAIVWPWRTPLYCLWKYIICAIVCIVFAVKMPSLLSDHHINVQVKNIPEKLKTIERHAEEVAPEPVTVECLDRAPCVPFHSVCWPLPPPYRAAHGVKFQHPSWRIVTLQTHVSPGLYHWLAQGHMAANRRQSRTDELVTSDLYSPRYVTHRGETLQVTVTSQPRLLTLLQGDTTDRANFSLHATLFLIATAD